MMTIKRGASLIAATLMLGSGTAALAQLTQPAESAVIFGDSGDTAWTMVSAAMVLLMAIGGLPLFFAGQVRRVHAAGVLTMATAVAAIVSLLWMILGYTLAFSPGTALIGGFDNVMLNAMGTVRDGTTVPETAFALFQMGVALIAPVIVIGALVERVRLSWLLVWSALWSLLVYAPITHWLWGGGWIAGLGAVDYAGGLAIFTSAGVSALVAATLVGRRSDDATTAPRTTRPSWSLVGAALLWFGAFGLVGGASLGASDDAASAILAAHVAACVGALVWLGMDRLHGVKAGAPAAATGVVAGLATIASAAGYVSIGAAIVISLIGVALAHVARRWVARTKVDDALGVFATMGVGAIAGTLLVALFLSPTLGGTGYAAGVGMGGQLMAQAIAVLAVAAWSGVVSLILALGIALVLPMRMTPDQERDGTDTDEAD